MNDDASIIIECEKRRIMLMRKAIKYTIENQLNELFPEYKGEMELNFTPGHLE